MQQRDGGVHQLPGHGLEDQEAVSDLEALVDPSVYVNHLTLAQELAVLPLVRGDGVGALALVVGFCTFSSHEGELDEILEGEAQFRAADRTGVRPPLIRIVPFRRVGLDLDGISRGRLLGVQAGNRER